jgi:hypothetical protein
MANNVSGIINPAALAAAIPLIKLLRLVIVFLLNYLISYPRATEGTELHGKIFNSFSFTVNKLVFLFHLQLSLCFLVFSVPPWSFMFHIQ